MADKPDRNKSPDPPEAQKPGPPAPSPPRRGRRRPKAMLQAVAELISVYPAKD